MIVECGVCHVAYEESIRSTHCPHEQSVGTTVRSPSAKCICGHGTEMHAGPGESAGCFCFGEGCACHGYQMASKEEAEYVSPYFHGKPPVVNIPASAFNMMDWINDSIDRMTGAQPIWAMNAPQSNPFDATCDGSYPNNGGDITLKSLQAAYGSAKLGMQVKIDPYLPPDTIMLVDSKGTIHKIINIANAGNPYDGGGWCVGEMR